MLNFFRTLLEDTPFRDLKTFSKNRLVILFFFMGSIFMISLQPVGKPAYFLASAGMIIYSASVVTMFYFEPELAGHRKPYLHFLALFLWLLTGIFVLLSIVTLFADSITIMNDIYSWLGQLKN